MRRTHGPALPTVAVLALFAALVAVAGGAAAAPTPRTISFQSSTVTVGEGGGSAALVVTRSDAARPTTVRLDTTAVTATPSLDFIPASTTLEFAAGVSSVTVNVTIVNNTGVEGDETFTATLSRPRGGFKLASPSSVTVTITDNDAGQPAVQNGGFESVLAPWTIRRPLSGAQPQPALVTSPVHSGTSSVRLGGTFSGGAVDSQVVQRITLPSTGTVTLSWWYILEGEDLGGTPEYDWGDALIYSPTGGILEDLFDGVTPTSGWTQRTVILSTLADWSAELAGQDVDLVFGVRQDEGATPYATMWVDDVTLAET